LIDIALIRSLQVWYLKREKNIVEQDIASLLQGSVLQANLHIVSAVWSD